MKFQNSFIFYFDKKTIYLFSSKRKNFLHQLIYYDFKKNNEIVKNHFDKYFYLQNNYFIGKIWMISLLEKTVFSKLTF